MALAIDGSNKNNFSLASSVAVSLTTTKTDDIIVVIVGYEINPSTGAPTVTGVSDTASLSWHRRGGAHASTNGHDSVIDCWWAHAPAILSSDTITVSLSGSVDDGAVVVCGVSGMPAGLLSAPFDTNVALPATGTTTVNGANDVVINGVSTTSTAGLLLANAGSSASLFSSAPTGLSPWSLVQWFKNTGGANFWTGAECDVNYSSALSNATETPINGFNAGNTVLYYLDALGSSYPATVILPINVESNDYIMHSVEVVAY